MLAGIWQEAEYKGDRRIAFAILTDEPNDLVASSHDRMHCRFLAGEHIAGVALEIRNSALPDLREFGQMLAGPFEASAGGSALQAAKVGTDSASFRFAECDQP
jgi:hypothetical protein